MKFHRIFAIFLRHWFLFKRSLAKMSDSFYWISIDILLWGITSTYFQKFSASHLQIAFATVSGLILWNVVLRSNNELSIGLLEEIWNRNLINIFVSPLKFSEWLTSLMIMTILKMFLTVAYAAGLIFVLFKMKFLDLGANNLLLFIGIMSVWGWAIGFFVTGIVFRFGAKIQSFAWTAIFVIMPFSSVFFPVSALPSWAQTVAAFLPSSYVFEEMRHFLQFGAVNYDVLLTSFILSALYFVLFLFFIKSSFQAVLKKGLLKVF